MWQHKTRTKYKNTHKKKVTFCGQSDDTVRNYASYLVSKTIIMWITLQNSNGDNLTHIQRERERSHFTSMKPSQSAFKSMYIAK